MEKQSLRKKFSNLHVGGVPSKQKEPFLKLSLAFRFTKEVPKNLKDVHDFTKKYFGIPINFKIINIVKNTPKETSLFFLSQEQIYQWKNTVVYKNWIKNYDLPPGALERWVFSKIFPNLCSLSLSKNGNIYGEFIIDNTDKGGSEHVKNICASFWAKKPQTAV